MGLQSAIDPLTFLCCLVIVLATSFLAIILEESQTSP